MARMNGIQDVAKTSPDPLRVLWVILATNKPVFKILFFSLFFVQKERESHRKGRTGYSAAGAQRATRPSLSLSFHPTFSSKHAGLEAYRYMLLDTLGKGE